MLNLDAKYSALIDELEALNGKLNTFINGAANVTIVTDAGTIKTLAGLIADFKLFRYVQKVIDYELHATMLSNDLDIETGLLVRIWGDTTIVNGLYKKISAGVYTKITYEDLNDLLAP